MRTPLGALFRAPHPNSRSLEGVGVGESSVLKISWNYRGTPEALASDRCIIRSQKSALDCVTWALSK